MKVLQLNVAQRVSVVVDWSSLPAQKAAVYLNIRAIPDMYATDPAIPMPYEIIGGGLDVNFRGLVVFKQIGPLSGFVETADHLGNITLPIHHETNILAARPATPLVMPTPTHLMYLEIEFFADKYGVNRGSFNHIFHANAMTQTPPSLFKQTIFGKADNGADTPVSSDFHALNTPPQGIPPHHGLISGYELIGGNKNSQYFLPAGAVVLAVINNSKSLEIVNNLLS